MEIFASTSTSATITEEITSRSSQISVATTTEPASSPNVTVQIVMEALYIAVGVVGVVSNLVIICLMLQVSKLRLQSRNWFIFHQCLAEFVTSVFVVVLGAASSYSAFNYNVSISHKV